MTGDEIRGLARTDPVLRSTIEHGGRSGWTRERTLEVAAHALAGRIAVAVQILERVAASDALYDAMLATKRGGERRTRDAFQERYGAFLKCDGCGVYASIRGDSEPAHVPEDCDGRFRLVRYSPPPGSEGA